MIASLLLLPGLLFSAEPAAIGGSLTADLDGDGHLESVTAAPARAAVRLQVRDAAGRRLADAKAPAPAGDVVPVALTSGPLGSAGALVEVVAATDTTECRTFWRYRDGALTKLPLRDAAGKTLPECGGPQGWSARWESAGAGKPAAWVRETTRTVEAGSLRTRETYAFAGFSLDFDAARSASEIGGIPIPAWYRATLYSRAALEILYSRFQLAAMRAEPTLAIEADRPRGVFALRMAGPAGELLAAVDSYASASLGKATLGVRAGGRTARAEVRLGGDGTVPLTVVVEGFGPDWDRSYSPAGTWRGGSRQVFRDAADELAVSSLPGDWADSRGGSQSFAVGGEPPYRVRQGGAAYAVDVDGAAAPFDVLLLPVGPEGRAWGLVLRGANRLDRVPVACAAPTGQPPCRADGDTVTLRRIGARVNAR